MPNCQEWLTFDTWAEIYGDIVSAKLLGQRYVVLNSSKAVLDLLERRSNIYDDRPPIPMAGELVGWKGALFFMYAGSKHRKQRKLGHKLFGSKDTMERFHPLEEQETYKFLARVLESPANFQEHIRHTAVAIIFKIIYGYPVLDSGDPYIALEDEALWQFSQGAAPARFWVNILPTLKHVPDWMPGAGFKTVAKQWAKTLTDAVEDPWKWTLARIAEGDPPPSFVASLLSEENVSEKDEEDIKWLALSLSTGGSDTTVSAIHAFFKAMVLFPSVQVRARKELDAITGGERMPTFADRSRLPYIEACVKETMRWHTVVPIGAPHKLLRDDIYDGYFIPKGTIVWTNIRRILHSPELYENPDIFEPERWMQASPPPDPAKVYFGSGSRICPGRVLAEASIYITVASVLATLDISCDPDAPVPDQGQHDGVISHPTAFKCRIRARSPKHHALVRQAAPRDVE